MDTLETAMTQLQNTINNVNKQIWWSRRKRHIERMRENIIDYDDKTPFLQQLIKPSIERMRAE